VAHVGAQVARAENVPYLSRLQQLLELGWEVADAVRDVYVPDAQDEYHCWWAMSV
jgi:hypothetical protein